MMVDDGDDACDGVDIYSFTMSHNYADNMLMLLIPLMLLILLMLQLPLMLDE